MQKMEKTWKNLLMNNKAVQLLSKYLIGLIREMDEKDILGDILKANMGYDEILIEESSKDIIDVNSSKRDNPLRKTKNNKLNRGISSLYDKRTNVDDDSDARKVELIYFCLLKFRGLIRYMNFQGLKHGDIKKISYFIRHVSFNRGEYIFRQGDKSDALYGVITGKVIIRFIKPIDFLRKLSYENILEEDLIPVNNIPIDYFISDCEEESSEEPDSENENENEKKKNLNNNLIDFENNNNENKKNKEFKLFNFSNDNKKDLRKQNQNEISINILNINIILLSITLLLAKDKLEKSFTVSQYQEFLIFCILASINLSSSLKNYDLIQTILNDILGYGFYFLKVSYEDKYNELIEHIILPIIEEIKNDFAKIKFRNLLGIQNKFLYRRTAV